LRHSGILDKEKERDVKRKLAIKGAHTKKREIHKTKPPFLGTVFEN
jgi:hypothetical protein